VRFHGGELPVLSVYVGLSGPETHAAVRTKVDSLLHRVRPTADDHALAHEARLSLREDMARIGDVTSYDYLRRGTRCFFCCSGADLFEIVDLPRPVRDRVVIDATPWVRPMLAVLDESLRCCAVVLDSESAHQWELYLGQLRDAGPLRDPSSGKPAYASSYGVSERGGDKHAEELQQRHFRHLAEALDRLFRADRYDLLMLGGHDHELARFVEFLPRALRKRVAGTFPVDPKKKISSRVVREHVEVLLDRHELEEQQQSVAAVLEIATTGGLAALGLERCLWAGSLDAVQALLVQDGAVVAGVVCDQSRWFALSGESCPLCGRRTRHTSDVIDELIEAVIDEGGSIHLVRADTELEELLVAASLRFPLPPMP
jgi:peptide chain release factor subunit 1